MSVTLGSITPGILNTLTSQASSNGSSVEQKIQKLQKQIVKLTKVMKELISKAAEAGSVDDINMFKKQIRLIQQQIQALYAEISRLQRQDAEKNSTVSAASTTRKADLSQDGMKKGHKINIYA